MQKKALIIGIDGLPHDLLARMLEKGIMHHLKDLLGEGYRVHSMHASLPEVSSVSWTSFMTGVNPGQHGIFGFTHLRPGTYDLHLADSRDIHAPIFWQTLSSGRKIKRALVLNVPNTYPAFPIEGLLVSGFVAIDLEKAVYPGAYVPLLKGMNYIMDVEVEKGRSDKEGLYKDILHSLLVRRYVSLSLFDREPWDLAIVCLTETDRLHHFFFDEQDGPAFDAVYGIVDHTISDLYSAARRKWGEDFLFMILSDHGFSILEKEVNLNALLQQEGFLRLGTMGDHYGRVAPGTTAFAMDPGRVYIHYQDRYPDGHVRREQSGEVREELKRILLELKDEDGTSVIQSIYENEDIYKGPFSGQGPDLVCVSRPGYDLKGNLRRQEVFTRDIFRGAHTWDNAVLVTPAATRVEGPIDVEYAAAIVLDHFSQGE